MQIVFIYGKPISSALTKLFTGSMALVLGRLRLTDVPAHTQASPTPE